MYISGRR